MRRSRLPATRSLALPLILSLWTPGCDRGAAPPTSAPPPAPEATTTPTPAAPKAVPPATVELPLSITYDPRVTFHEGWVALPERVPLHALGNPGASILDLTRARLGDGDPARARLLAHALAAAPTPTLIVDEASACAPALAAAVAEAKPPRLMITFPEGIPARAVGCLAALPSEALYLAGCLHRPHRSSDACDGDAELEALVADAGLRPRIRGLALSLASAAAVARLGELPHLERLALSPGKGAGHLALVDALPFAALPELRALEAAGENAHASAWDPDALALLGRLHTLRWNGELLGPIPAPCALQRVSFDRLHTPDVEALAACGDLRELSSDSVDLDTLDALAPFVELRRLHLRHVRADALAPLARATRLEALDLPAAKSADFAFLAGMTSLVELDLSQTGLESLAPLASLRGLRRLDLGFTAIRDLGPLAGLVLLEELDLGSTQVRDLRPLAGLERLRELSLGETPVADIAALAKLPRLEKVTLHGSAVTDIAPLLAAPQLKTVTLRGLKLPPAQVEALRGRPGVTVHD
ncbi:MAG: leucine-rich repeat domain-containing protein [Nannocystaceae bacterium]